MAGKKKPVDSDKPKNPAHRPCGYTPEIADVICEIVATHPYGLPKLCKMFPQLPHPDTIRVWRWKFHEFSVKYAKSKQFQAELMAESIDDIIEETADDVYLDEHGNRKLDSGILGLARLKVDSRKWTASKLAPKIYGDRTYIDNTHSIKHEESIKDLE